MVWEILPRRSALLQVAWLNMVLYKWLRKFMIQLWWPVWQSVLQKMYTLKDNFLTCRFDLYIAAIPPPFLFSLLWVFFIQLYTVYILAFRYCCSVTFPCLCPCFCDKKHVNVIELDVVYEHVKFRFKRLHVNKYHLESSWIPKGSWLIFLVATISLNIPIHINKLTSSSFNTLRNISRIRCHLDQETTKI